MSDHISGPRAVADPVTDITDIFAFPSPESPRNLVLIMNVFPYAGPSACFSDAVIYRFRVRPVSIAPDRRAFAAGADELAFDCTFDVPSGPDSGGQPIQQGRCTMPNGEVVSFGVNDETGGRGEGLHVFAGQRSDPFFLDGPMAGKTLATGQLAFKQKGSDRLYGKNVLGIVLTIEWATLLEGGPMFAVVGETLTSGKRPIRLERVGRPEIKNISLGAKAFDPVNRDLEIRDLYNNEDAFNLSEHYIGAYRARLNANLVFYDGLDGKTEWPLDEHGNHPLTELLLADYLIVDASKPFCETSYFEIEQAMLGGRAHATCGGRWLNEDVVDFILTLYVNAGNGPRISDGVDGPITWSSKVCPYMAAPNRPEVASS
jgi:Domain of unknown function (DUF4331)